MSDVAMAICTDVDTDADVAYLDQLCCYDVISAYILFTFTAKEGREIMLSPRAVRLPPVAATADSLVHVI